MSMLEVGLGQYFNMEVWCVMAMLHKANTDGRIEHNEA